MIITNKCFTMVTIRSCSGLTPSDHSQVNSKNNRSKWNRDALLQQLLSIHTMCAIILMTSVPTIGKSLVILEVMKSKNILKYASFEFVLICNSWINKMTENMLSSTWVLPVHILMYWGNIWLTLSSNQLSFALLGAGS